MQLFRGRFDLYGPVPIHSYNGQMIVGIAGDTTLVPDHESPVEGFGLAFCRLLPPRTRTGPVETGPDQRGR